MAIIKRKIKDLPLAAPPGGPPDSPNFSISAPVTKINKDTQINSHATINGNAQETKFNIQKDY